MNFFMENFNSLKMALPGFLSADCWQTSINGTDVEGQHPVGFWHKEPLGN